ncbi:MAG: efflux RND transporter periplasmic adaptor subunit [Planctomycetota bacterium]
MTARYSRRSWRWVVIGVGVVALAGVVWARYVAHKAKNLATPARARAHDLGVPVRTALVSAETLETVIGAPGVTAPCEQVSLRFGASPKLNELNPMIRAVQVRDGAYVKAGDIVFEFESVHVENALRWKERALGAAEAAMAYAKSAETENAISREVELNAAASELEFRRSDVDYRREDSSRLTKLRESGNASFTEYLEAASAYAEAQYKYTQAIYRDRVAKAEMVLGPLRDRRDSDLALGEVKSKTYERAQAAADLQRCALRSPIDGVVDQIIGAQGQVVDVEMTLGQVLKIDPIYMQVDFPQERIGELAVGQPAEVVLDAFPHETFGGKVARISGRVNAEERVLPVIVELPNPDHRIKVGVSGFARIHAARQATTVPAVALIGIESAAMAFVVEDGRARIRKVKPGPVVHAGHREVEEGLAPGDEVVVYGQQDLLDGDAVNSNWRQWARRD